RRRAAAREPAARRSRALVRPARLVAVPHGAAAGRDPVGRLGPAPRARPGVAVPCRGRAARRLDGSRVHAQRLADVRARRPDPARHRAARPARNSLERAARAVRTGRSEEVDVTAEVRLLAQPWQGDTLGDTTSLQYPWAMDGVRGAARRAREKETT